MFAEGFHDHLLTQLYGVRGFRVTSRQSVIQYKQSQKRSRDIAQELGVGMLMEGSVLRVGDRVRVEAQLIDGKTEGHIWSRTYDGDFRDIFKVQADIAQNIALSLRAALTSGEKESLERPITNNKEAYEYYLKGNHFWENYTSLQGNDTAIAMYERATTEDPGFTEAYAMIATVCFSLAVDWTFFGIVPGPYVRRGEAALERAAALDRDNWLVLRAQADHHMLRKENAQALAILRRVRDRQPNDAGILEDLGILLLRMRRLEEALPVFAREYELNPKMVNSGQWIGCTYGMMRRWDDALKWFDLIIAQKPEYVYGYLQKINVLVDGFGNPDKARSVLEEGLLRVKDVNERSELLREKYRCALIARDFGGALAILNSKEFEGCELALGGSGLVFRCLQMGHTYRMMGKLQEALNCYASVKDTLEGLTGQRPDDPTLHIQLSQAYAGLRGREEALREGRRAIELAPLGESAILSGEGIREDFVHINLMVGEFDVAIAHLDTLLSIPSQMKIGRAHV
jgi:TolB-like protein